MSYQGKTIDEIKTAMDARYSSQGGAYHLGILWDQVRMEDLNQKTMAYLGERPGKILEVCCGQGGTAAYLTESADFTGVELSSEAVKFAKQHWPHFTFIEGDASRLDFADNLFDTIIAKEAIEHLIDAEKALSEWFRVLKPGGKLVLTTPNRDSLHLRINRAAGHNDFLCSWDHVKEFTYSEMAGMIGNAGFRIVETCGSFLMPYWGIPGVDGVRRLTDNDTGVIQLLRDLGDKCGTEYAFCMIIKALKKA
jgi:ubiquinone/menaquinone biosynthesis C-methylase UbiE